MAQKRFYRGEDPSNDAENPQGRDGNFDAQNQSYTGRNSGGGNRGHGRNFGGGGGGGGRGGYSSDPSNLPPNYVQKPLQEYGYKALSEQEVDWSV